MSGKNFSKIVVVLTVAFAFLPIGGCKKHEHPKSSTEKTEITKEQLADAIETYIKSQAAANDGYFLITDEKTDQQIQMTLVKVHRERLAKVDEDRYFACVDFETPDGKLYDVDFFMEGPDEDNLTFSEFMIHKKDGKERYTWYKEGDIWKNRPVEAIEQPEEQPMEESAEQPKEEPNEPPAEEPKEPEQPEEPNEPEHPREHPTEHPS